MNSRGGHQLIHFAMHTFLFLLLVVSSAAAQPYRWLNENDPAGTVGSRFDPPPGFTRDSVAAGSFGEWLRNLPLKPGNPPVHLFDGSLKKNQNVHAAVVDIDVGEFDLQQCADAVIRLRAEYLFANGDFSEISFNFTSGDEAAYSRWVQGYRPLVKGNQVTWKQSAAFDSSYANFRRYLESVMTYAGTFSLRKQLKRIANVRDLQIGDVFIQGGFPGHAVIVVDRATHAETREAVFLLAQSFMPAQDVHILCHYDCEHPWYSTEFGEILATAQWNFLSRDLYRFPDSE